MNIEKEQVLRGFEFFKNRDLQHDYDPLTGVVNRQTMTEYIQSLIASSAPFSLCLFDLDNFKTVNDTFGHKTGDVVLEQTSHYIADVVADRGVVGRFGGDEFFIVLEGVSEYDEVWSICHNISVGLKQFKLKGVSGLTITLTMGVCRFPCDAANYDSLFELADKMLYRGKMKGRSCFIIYLAEKHKNLNLKCEQDKGISSMALCARSFKLLTETPCIATNIANLFKYLVSYYMFDHICIETNDKICLEVMHTLAKNKQFKPIDLEKLKNFENVNGFVSLNTTSVLSGIRGGGLMKELEEQHISSALYCKIAVHGREYGYIRVDMTDTSRVWQPTEIDLVMMAANMIALMLYSDNITPNEFIHIDSAVIGETAQV
jgi:diguanylate cyclase (GGDEF)-like protein